MTVRRTGRLVELRAKYGRELCDCQRSFFIR
jgi:hypothetical protein